MKEKRSAIEVPEGLERVLLHACCAPCSSAIVEWMLAHGIRPTIYYYNPNIYPREEYEIRKAESKRHAEAHQPAISTTGARKRARRRCIVTTASAAD